MLIDALNIQSTLSTTIGNSGGSHTATRLPMIFTSLQRLRKTNSSFGTLAGTTQEALSNISKAERKKFTGSSTIEMAVNPNSITWRQPKRIVKRDVQNGSIFFHFSNSKRQNNDILTMEFRGNTGYMNIDADANKNGINTGAYNKLLLWHNLWNLTREAIYLEDGTPNEFYIMYSSRAIPINMLLVGFFSGVLEWTDSADKPFSKDYSMGFTVTNTIPSIDALVQSISQVTSK